MSSSIVVNANQKGKKIERDIYGHFSEHLGRCIYGGLWVGPDSSISNISGYRKDVVDALKQIQIPNLRWPGGCFADEYHWKDGIGPKPTRKHMVNTNWGGVVEDNSFGTHEFMNLCELLDCKAYVCGNAGSGSVQEMQEWVEYMTFGGESPMSQLRAKNGRENPWKLSFFGVGNENWGCGGNMRPEYYTDLYRRYQTYVRKYGTEKIAKIAGGPNTDDYNWTEVLMREAGQYMDGLSLHYYVVPGPWEHKGSATEFDEGQWFTTLKKALRMEELVRRHSEIMDKYDSEARVALVVDEWGCWYDVEPGTNPGFLYQQNTMRDALVAGLTLNIFNNHAQRVRMANLAQLANVLQSPILTEGAKMVRTPTYHVFDMYKTHQNATQIGISIASEAYMVNGEAIPMLQGSASYSDKGFYTITICNTSPTKAIQIPITLCNASQKINDVEAYTLAAPTMNAMNTFESPNTVHPELLAVKKESDTSILTILPAMSVTTLLIYE